MGCLFQAKTVSQLSQNDNNFHSRKEESIRNSLHFCLCPPNLSPKHGGVHVSDTGHSRACRVPGAC